MRKIVFTSEQKSQMMKMKMEGVTQSKIADVFGCSTATVSRALSDYEPVKTKTLTPEEQADLIELSKEGVELSEIANDYGCDVETLEYYIRKHKRAENRTKESNERVVCGDKFSGVLIDKGNGEFHGTRNNGDGSFEHMDIHGETRETARKLYQEWCGQKVWLVMPETACFVTFGSDGEARDFAKKVELLTGCRMAVREFGGR